MRNKRLQTEAIGGKIQKEFAESQITVNGAAFILSRSDHKEFDRPLHRNRVLQRHRYYNTQPYNDFTGFLTTLQPKNGSREIWFKAGHADFYVGEWNESGDFVLYATKKKGEAAETRIKTHEVSDSAYNYLRAKSEAPLRPNKDGDLPPGGVFYIPTQPQGSPAKSAVDSTDDLGCEMDTGATRDEQLAQWGEFTQVSGLNSASLLTSGGGSVHGHIKLIEHYPIAEAQYLRRLLAIGMIGDPAVVNPHQPMRIPGFFRFEKQAEQELLHLSHDRYTYDQVVTGLKAWFDHISFAFPVRISEEWWQHLKQQLKIAEKTGDQAPLIEALSAGIDSFEHKQQEEQVIRETKRASIANLESNGLLNQVKELADRLGASAFELRPHCWKGTASHKRGSCTFHQSKSNSAWISNKDGTATFRCPTCTHDKPLDAFGYWLSHQRGSVITQYPKGKEWAEAAKNFLRDYGVTPVEKQNCKRDRNSSEFGAPDPVSYQKHIEQEQERDRVEEAEEKERQKESKLKNKLRFSAEVQESYEYATRLDSTPTLDIGDRFLEPEDIQLPEKGGLILTDLSMGQRKTSVGAKEITRQHRASNPHADAVLFVARLLLGQQAGSKIGLPHHRSEAQLEKEFLKLSACFQSGGLILPVALNRVVNGRPLIMFDEVGQLLEELLDGSTYGSNHAFHIALFQQLCRWIIENDGWIVLSEDGLSNLELEMFTDCGLKVVSHLKGRLVHKDRQINLVEGKKQLYTVIEDELNKGGNVADFRDSQESLRETALILVEEFGLTPITQENFNDPTVAGQCVIVIDRDNSHEDWVKDLIENSDSVIERLKPRYFGASPTLQSGFSCDDPHAHFTHVFGLLTNLPPRTAKQLPERIRTDIDRTISVSNVSCSLDPRYASANPNIIKRNLIQMQKQTFKRSGFLKYALERATKENGETEAVELLGSIASQEQQADDITTPYGFYLKHLSRFKAREAYGKRHLKSELCKIWKKAGYKIESLNLELAPEEKERLKELFEDARKKLDRQKAIVQAGDRGNESLTVSDAHELLNSRKATPEQRVSAFKRIQKDNLPGLEKQFDDVEFVLKCFVQERGSYAKGAERYWLMQDPKIARILDQWELTSKYRDARKTGTFVPIHRLKHRHAQAATLNKFKQLLDPFINGTIQKWDDNTPQVQAVWDYFNVEGDSLAEARRLEIAKYNRLSIHPGRSPSDTVNTILRHINFKVEAVSRCGKDGESKKRLRQYAITNREDTDRTLIMEALQRRFIERLRAIESNPAEELPLEQLYDIASVYEFAANEPHEYGGLLQELEISLRRNTVARNQLWLALSSPAARAILDQRVPFNSAAA